MRVKITAQSICLDLSQHRGHYLTLESKKIFYLFINSKFALKGSGSLKLSADSLRKKYSTSSLLSFNQKNDIADLSIKWAVQNPFDDLYIPRRQLRAFPIFIIVASLTIIIFLPLFFAPIAY